MGSGFPGLFGMAVFFRSLAESWSSQYGHQVYFGISTPAVPVKCGSSHVESRYVTSVVTSGFPYMSRTLGDLRATIYTRNSF